MTSFTVVRLATGLKNLSSCFSKSHNPLNLSSAAYDFLHKMLTKDAMSHKAFRNPICMSFM